MPVGDQLLQGAVDLCLAGLLGALASAVVFWVSSLAIALSTDFRAARFSFSWAFRSAMQHAI